MKRLAGFALLVVLLALLSGCYFFNVTPNPPPNPQPGAVLFSDDFEGGPDPAWQFASGDWDEESGQLKLVNSQNGAAAYVSTGYSWSDYVAEVQVLFDYGYYLGSGVGIICRAQNDMNKIVFWIKSDKTYFTIYENGEVVSDRLSQSAGNVDFNSPFTVSVTVNGTTFAGKVNGVTRSQITDSRFQVGTAGITGLLMGDNTAFDNFRVVSEE